MSTKEFLQPVYDKLDTALRSIGYSLEVAVADIIDNSIDAKAKSILVRVIMRQDGHLDLLVWDDGHGMDAETLRDAMRFGADVSHELKRLGKFGLGLKLASLSQAREVHVISANDGIRSGRAWAEDGIKKGFVSEIFDSAECDKLLSELVPDRPLGRTGTVVRWSQLYRLRRHHSDPEEHAQKILSRLEVFLSLAFHRFLSGQAWKTSIEMDIYDIASAKRGIPVSLDAIDPFGYPESGNPEFPAKMALDGPYQNRITVTAHVWPPNSKAPEYRLHGGANSRQGFYFYRNNRLIQGGGWNGLREAEPHSSLARLEIDVADDFDLELSLDVKKVEIQMPPELVLAIQSAKTAAGIDFRKYLSIADDCYRKRALTEAELPLIPSAGLPADLAAFLHEELKIRGTSKHRDLKIAWKALDRSEFFELDRDEGYLYLNSAYRHQLQHGIRASSTDIPVLKCLLFFVLEGALSSERMSTKTREQVERINRVLVKAVRYERGVE